MSSNPNFTGNWRANIEKSRFVSGPLPKEITAEIDHSDLQLRIEIVSIALDGTESRAVFTCAIAGDEKHCTLNGKAIRGKAAWNRDELIIESWAQFGDRKIYLRDCWSLADSCKTLTMQHRDDALAGQRTVLEKVA